MAISIEQRVDYLFKKLGFTLSKTDTSTNKSPSNESIPSPLIIPGSIIWSKSQNIPATPPVTDTADVKVFPESSALQLTMDNTTVIQKTTFIAKQGGNIIGDWIDKQFGSGYGIKVYANNPNNIATRIELDPNGTSTNGISNNDTWFFDYSSGVLNFNGTTIPDDVGTSNVFIVGWRYIGAKGVLSEGGQTQTSLSVANLNVTGVTTLGTNFSLTGITTLGITSATQFVSGISTLGNASASNLNVTGISTFGNGTTGVKIDGVNGIVTSTNPGVTTVTFVGNLAGTATTAGFAQTAFTLDSTNAVNIKVGFATTATDVIGGIGSISRLSVSGISTFGNSSIGVKIDGVNGIVTSTNPGVTTVTFIGNLTGTASTAGFAATAFSLNGFTPSTGSVGFASTAIDVIGGIGSLSRLTVSGISTFGNSSIGVKIDGVNGIVTSSNPGVTTVTFVGNLTGTASTTGFARTAFTLDSTNAVNIKVGFATTATDVIGGIGSLSRLSVSGLSTFGNSSIGVLIDGVNGIVTSSNPGVTTITYFGDGSKLSGIKGVTVEFQAQIAQTLFPTLAANSGVSSIGIATTGSTALCYIPSSGNLGIGTTIPSSKLTVSGNIRVTGVSTFGNSSIGVLIDGVNGIVTSTNPGVTTVTFIGNLAGTASTASFATTSFTLDGRREYELNVAFAQTAGISTNVIGGIGSITQLSVSGVTTSGEFVGGASDLRNLQGTHLVSYSSYSGSSNSSMSISGISTYIEIGTLSGSLAVDFEDQFGYSVATSADGKTIVVGARKDELSENSLSSGLVYVFDRNGNSFNQVGILTGTYTSTSDFFGSSVATSADGKTIIVGATSDGLPGVDGTGLVYVFDRIGNSFNQVGVLTGFNAINAGDDFGIRVATSADGKNIVVGASSDETTGSNTGLVYVFDRIGNSFNQVGVLNSGIFADTNDLFGFSVAMSADGKTIIAGAPADQTAGSNTGLVYVFERTGNSFNQIGILTGTNSIQSEDLFGYSVAISADGKTIAVGSRDDEVPGANTATGVVYVYDRVVNSFNQVGILTGTFSTQAGDRFGNFIAISADGKKIAVGAMDDELPSPTSSGAVYVFNRVGNTFNRVASFRGSFAIDGSDHFGNAVAISADGKSIIVGSFEDSLVLGDINGIAYVFDEVIETYLHSNPQGNIGIGTSNPTSKLHVVGNSLVTGITTIVGNLNAQSSVGIGTTNPTSKLHIVGNALVNGITTITGNLNAPGNYYVKLARTANQTIPNNGDTLIGFTATSDTNGWYSGITTRTTPTVAGTYRVDAMINWQAGTITTNQTNIQIRKNGSTFALHQVGITTFSYSQTACGIVTMNGTSDYIDFTAFTGNTTNQVVTGTSDGAWTKMEIFKIN